MKLILILIKVLKYSLNSSMNEFIICVVLDIKCCVVSLVNLRVNVKLGINIMMVDSIINCMFILVFR